MESLIQAITPLVETYGVLGVFFLSLIQEIIAPVPSALVLMAAGFFLIPQGLPFSEIVLPALFQVILPAAFGLTLGSLFIYSVAYLGGKPLIIWWGRFFNITWEKLERAEARFTATHADEVTIFSLRAVPIIPDFLISAVCGLVRYPLKEFILLTFFGSVVRAILMGFLGWSVGAAYVQYAEELSALSNLVAVVVIALFALTALFFLLRRKFRF